MHWCLVFNSFFVFHSEAKHRKHKSILGTNFFENVVSNFEEKNLNLALVHLIYGIFYHGK